MVAAVERYVLPRVLGKTQGNISQSAKMLGITRGSLRTRSAPWDCRSTGRSRSTMAAQTPTKPRKPLDRSALSLSMHQLSIRAACVAKTLCIPKTTCTTAHTLFEPRLGNFPLQPSRLVYERRGHPRDFAVDLQRAVVTIVDSDPCPHVSIVCKACTAAKALKFAASPFKLCRRRRALFPIFLIDSFVHPDQQRKCIFKEELDQIGEQ